MKSVIFLLFMNCFKLTVSMSDDERPNENINEQGVVHKTKTWISHLITYSYSEDNVNYYGFTEREKIMIRKGIDTIIMSLVPGCLEFEENRVMAVHNQKSHLIFSKVGNKCNSHVGRNVDGLTKINLGSDCFDNRGIILHELLHAIGVYHEMTRPDRDLFLDVDENEIIPEHRIQFQRRNCSKYDLSLLTPYDFYSVTNYYENQGCKDDQTVCMKAKDVFKQKLMKDNSYPLEHQMMEMSATDIVDISKRYECQVLPEIMVEYVKYVLDITEAMLDYADTECKVRPDCITCKALKFEVSAYLGDLELHWKIDFGNEMKQKFCKLREQLEGDDHAKHNTEPLHKWFQKHEKLFESENCISI